MAEPTKKRTLRAEIGLNPIPMVKRATGRMIPDLTGREHVCEWQSSIQGKRTVSGLEEFLREGKQVAYEKWQKAESELARAEQKGEQNPSSAADQSVSTELERTREQVEKSLAKDGREYLAHDFERLVREDALGKGHYPIEDKASAGAKNDVASRTRAFKGKPLL